MELSYDLPNEIIHIIGDNIHQKRTFYNFALCFPNIARLLKTKKQFEFSIIFKPIIYKIPRMGDFFQNYYEVPILPVIITEDSTSRSRCSWKRNIGNIIE